MGVLHHRRSIFYLCALFLLALVPRLYGAHTVGWGWDHPGSFTLVNFDEAGSCRAALGGFDYSTFVGRQTIALATVLGNPPPRGGAVDAKAVKAWCHSAGHVTVARDYAAVTGALTVVVLASIALLLVPGVPQVAWTAGALLALSGFHISESQTGTVDAPSIFFIYLFLAVVIYSVQRGSWRALLASPVFMLAAIWTKYWVFAIFAYLGAVPTRVWRYLGQGLSRTRVMVLVVAAAAVMALVTNPEFDARRWFLVPGLYYLLVPWRGIRRVLVPVFLLVPVAAFALSQVGIIASFTTGGAQSPFGTGYAAIGWHKWLRNLVNIPAVLIVGLGLPACAFLPAGIRAVLNDSCNGRAWLCLAPVAVFALYMLFLAPVTYYRHYLALIPAAALLAALGLWRTQLPRRRWFRPVFLPLFFLWPAMLALDMLADYQQDPRIELRQWYAQHPGAQVFISYYVNPPITARGQSRLFRPEYAVGDASALRQANYLILSENWYDTAFANELNGPVVSEPARLIKTRPQYAAFYRAALANTQSTLRLERAIDVSNFMPELLVHKWLYGTFQMFVGDIKIYRVVQ